MIYNYERKYINGLTKIKSGKHASNIFKCYGFNEDIVQLVSFGNSGCYLFFIDNNDKLSKVKISNIGITYLSDADIVDIINELPIKGKKEYIYETQKYPN